MEGFVFPNEIKITWSVMIALYPYITGLVAGAFIVSSLHHVFGDERLKEVSLFSLVSALVFLIFAPLPLLVHLGHPLRSYRMLVTSNFSSAMAGFGYIYSSYMIVVLLEIWFVLREKFVAIATSDRRIMAPIFRLILLGRLEINAETKRIDAKIIKILAGIGIPMACLLHGYVGFLFGSLKANPWWSTPLMFIIFLFSAIVSGISVLIVHYMFVSKINKWALDQRCVRALGKYLWGFMIVAIGLELMELLSIGYKQTEEWEVLNHLITDKLFWTYVVFQYVLCSAIPFAMLAANSLLKLKDSVSNLLLFLSAGMLLIQVALMRWNVVIGGQLLSKSYRGYTSYLPGLWEKEGVAVALVIFTLPFILLWLFHRYVVHIFPAAGRVSPSSPQLDPQ